jgi:hypothetical protein
MSIPKIIVVNDLFRLSLNSYAAKDTICSFFYKKDPKLSLSELLSMMARIQFNPTLRRFMLFIDNDLLLPGAKLHILNNIYRK